MTAAVPGSNSAARWRLLRVERGELKEVGDSVSPRSFEEADMLAAAKLEKGVSSGSDIRRRLS